MRNPDADLLAGLSDHLDDTLRIALDGARKVALVNFPNHANPGDSAIWLGARASLARIGVKVKYQSVWDTFSVEALKKALPDGPVLINGGGNFGDLYAGQQGTRELIFRELKGRRLVQLPQSIHFRDPANLERNRRLVAEHGQVTIIAREKRTEAIATEKFDARVLLSPDCAFGLGSLRAPRTDPSTDLLWIHRLPGDPEFVDHGAPPAGLTSEIVEWINPQPVEPAWAIPHRLARKSNLLLRARAQSNPTWARLAWRPLGATLVPLGRGYTLRGVDLLGRGRFLVTDKLHGHIMALLAGVPHVVMDNGYHKVLGTYEAWTHDSELAQWAETGEEAGELALARLGAAR